MSKKKPLELKNNNLYDKLRKYKRILNREGISIITEFIVIGYARNISNKNFIINIIIDMISQFYGNTSLSNIIHDKLWYPFIEMISNQLNTNNMKLNKIFEAKMDGFTTSSFHKKCDNKGATLCIIQNEYDYIFGGYTSKSWKSRKTGSGVHDDNAFIYGIQPQLFISELNPMGNPNNSSYSVYHAAMMGPTFGIYSPGFDFSLRNDSDKNRASYSNTYRYIWDNSKPIAGDGQQFNCAVSFSVINYEVFVVE